MYSDDDLTTAIKAGIFSDESVDAFRALMDQQRQAPAADEEQFRLISGFNDIFVVIASILVLVSVAWVMKAFGSITSTLSVTVTSWLLAEFFVRKRHMALPAIILLLAYAWSVGMVCLLLLNAIPGVIDPLQMPGYVLAATAAITVFATFLHWRRFKVPITIAAGAGALCLCVFALITSQFAPESHWPMIITLEILGLAAFSFAMYWDTSDPLRQTRRADVAFWLHLLAAPMIVHPIFASLGIFDHGHGIVPAVIVIGLYVILALVSIAIDRRALMVSALVYVMYAFAAVVHEMHIVELNMAIAGLLIGSMLLLLSAFWHKSRLLIVGHFPEAIQHRLPPLK